MEYAALVQGQEPGTHPELAYDVSPPDVPWRRRMEVLTMVITTSSRWFNASSR